MIKTKNIFNFLINNNNNNSSSPLSHPPLFQLYFGPFHFFHPPYSSSIFIQYFYYTIVSVISPQSCTTCSNVFCASLHTLQIIFSLSCLLYVGTLALSLLSSLYITSIVPRFLYTCPYLLLICVSITHTQLFFHTHTHFSFCFYFHPCVSQSVIL